jgi:hypothetical protein
LFEVRYFGRGGIAALVLGFIVFVVSQAGRADSFQRVSYDPATDELVVVVAYSGTNPDHQFSVKWGRCIDHGAGGREIVGELLDRQFQDAAERDFTKSVRVSLAKLACRPAAITLRIAPRFYTTVTVPARPGTARR